MEPTIYKPGAYKTPGIYKGAGGIYKGRGAYKSGKKSFVRIGGHDYPIVKIGSQIWICENLDYKFDVNGVPLNIGGSGNPNTENAWYYNNNENDYGINGPYKCGLLYNWYAAKYLDDNKENLLPSGWRVPSLVDWQTLETFVNNSGKSLKALDSSIYENWPSGWNGTNEYGFNGIPSGDRWEANFYDLNSSCTFWTITPYDSTNINVVVLKFDPIVYLKDKKYQGFTIRLVKYV